MRAVRIALPALLFASPIGPAAAQSPPVASEETRIFVAIATTGSRFIDDAGQTALANGAVGPVQHFAHDAMRSRDKAQKRLASWAKVLQSAPAGAIVYDKPFEYGPIGLVFLPLNAAVIIGSTIANNAFDIRVGGAVVATDHQAELEWMQGLSGREFERAYIGSQLKAYRTLRDHYERYASTGDDPALRAVARAELPRLRNDIARLERL